MKAMEMYTEFLRKIQQSRLNLNFTELDTDDIFSALNEAQDKFIDAKYRYFFEKDQGTLDDLLPITVVQTLPVINDLIDLTQLQYGAIPDYTHLIRLEPLDINNCDLLPEMYQIRHDEINKILTNIFTKPKAGVRLHYTLLDNKIKFYTEDIITSCNVTYLRRPKRIAIATDPKFNYEEYTDECELLDYTHMDIVNLAISLVIFNNKQEDERK